ncbi:MAG TPA: FkbM family methyltransferase [Phnomibacter sp.]|nr:FkbM family methyltransferase [Phnomibacter sp.]
MKKIKSLLISALGRKRYLQLTSRVFLFYFKNGWLKGNPSYRTHYFVRNLIRPNDTVIDIGANLGYFSTEFARLVGTGGHVYSVEPIQLYRSILQENLKSFPQTKILPYALGETEGTISMGLPFADQHRHGLMKVLSAEEKNKAPEVFEVELKNPSKLFGQLTELQYLKCDIEGYEVPVLPTMKDVIARHMPLLQVETDGENKIILHRMFTEMGYQLFYVGEKGLVSFPDPHEVLPADLIGIPSNKTEGYRHLIAG